MNREEKIQYLANLYYLLASDGEISRLEERVLEEIVWEIGAGYSEKKRAHELSEEEDFCLMHPARWSDCIRNMEDLLLLAYADGRLVRAEKGVIKKFSENLGISKKQFDQLKDEAKKRYKRRKTQLGL